MLEPVSSARDAGSARGKPFGEKRLTLCVLRSLLRCATDCGMVSVGLPPSGQAPSATSPALTAGLFRASVFPRAVCNVEVVGLPAFPERSASPVMAIHDGRKLIPGP